METKIVKAYGDPVKDAPVMAEAGKIIKAGGLVAIPTETVYGLAGDALNPDSARKIYEAKGRASDNPLIVHIADIDDMSYITEGIPDMAYKLAEKFWPGPLTMILKKSDKVPLRTTGGLDTVAVRFPVNDIAREFIKASGGYIAAPSANVSGRPSCTSAKHCIEDLSGRIEMIIDGGEVGIGLESTIVDLTQDVPCLLRPGYISSRMLRDVLGDMDTDAAVYEKVSDDVRPKAPGMKYRHYAPKGELTIVRGPKDKVITEIRRRIAEHEARGEKCAVISSHENARQYDPDKVRDIGSISDEEEIGRRLFSILRDMDSMGIEYIYSESFDTPRLGEAIMNRLVKAAGHKVIEV